MLSVQNATREQIMGMPYIPAPENTSDRYQPVQHKDLVSSITNRLDKHGVIIEEEKFNLSKNDRELAGSFRVSIPNEEAPQGTAFSLGFHHALTGAHSIKFAAGLEIFICGNGMVSGDFCIKKMHTTGFNLSVHIEAGINQFLRESTKTQSTIDALKQRELADYQVNNRLMAAGREGLLPWSAIGKVDREYRNPTFKTFDRKDAWGLYNAFTYVAQQLPAHRQMKAISDFREVCLRN